MHSHGKGRVAQSAEHRANNARVVSSSLIATINIFLVVVAHKSIRDTLRRKSVVSTQIPQNAHIIANESIQNDSDITNPKAMESAKQTTTRAEYERYILSSKEYRN